MNSAPLLAIDIGNSSTKWGWFEASSQNATLPLPGWVQATFEQQASHPPDELLAAIARNAPEKLHWRVASVQRHRERTLAAWVREQRPHDDYALLTHHELPLEIEVDHPERVGLDRLAAAVAANRLRTPTQGAVVVGAGSAVTVDLLNPRGVFVGGTILPGFRMSARALSGADLLPEVLFEAANEAPPVLGKNTEGAIRSGLFWGTVGAVREIAARYRELLESEGTGVRSQESGEVMPLEIFVTGGDLPRLAPLIGSHVQFVPNLVLAGIALAHFQSQDSSA